MGVNDWRMGVERRSEVERLEREVEVRARGAVQRSQVSSSYGESEMRFDRCLVRALAAEVVVGGVA